MRPTMLYRNETLELRSVNYRLPPAPLHRADAVNEPSVANLPQHEHILNRLWLRGLRRLRLARVDRSHGDGGVGGIFLVERQLQVAERHVVVAAVLAERALERLARLARQPRVDGDERLDVPFPIGALIPGQRLQDAGTLALERRRRCRHGRSRNGRSRS